MLIWQHGEERGREIISHERRKHENRKIIFVFSHECWHEFSMTKDWLTLSSPFPSQMDDANNKRSCFPLLFRTILISTVPVSHIVIYHGLLYLFVWKNVFTCLLRCVHSSFNDFNDHDNSFLMQLIFNVTSLIERDSLNMNNSNDDPRYNAFHTYASGMIVISPGLLRQPIVLMYRWIRHST